MPDTTQMADLLPFFVDAAARGVVLLGLAGLFTLGLRRASASARHLVWSLALVGVLALPAVRAVAPRVEVPFPGLLADIPLLGESQWTGASPASVDRTPSVTDRARATEAAGSTAPAVSATADARLDPSDPVATGSGAAAGTATGPVERVGVGSYAERTSVGVPPAAETTGATLSLGATLLSVWLAIALVLLVPVVAGWVGVRRLGRRSRRLTEPHVDHLATRLALRIGLRREFRLLIGPPRTMPMTWGVLRPKVVLPPEALDWPESRLEAVLLHELAHVARRDCLTQLVAEIARAFHWFNPLVWLAARRLRVEREHACDDVALQGGARASDYADELLGLARTYHASRATTMAAVAMARPSQLSDRLLAVLDDRRDRRGLDRGTAVRGTLGAAALLLGLSAAAPADPLTPPDASPEPESLAARGVADHDALADVGIVPLAPVAPSPEPFALADGRTIALPQEASCAATRRNWNRVSHSAHDDRHTFEMEGGDCELEVRMEGDIEFDGAGLAIARLGPGAEMRIDEDDGRTERRLEIRPGADGRPEFAYRVNGRDAAFDAGARAWYDSVLIQLFRRAGFAAESRVESILARSGVEGVLAELGRIESSHVFARYTTLLLERAELDEAQIRALIRGAAGRVDSDHYLSEILAAVAAHQPLRGGILDDVITASTTLESDHYRSEVLKRVLASDRLTPVQVRATLASLSEIDSDHYRSELLKGVAQRYALEPDIRAAYLLAAAEMESDHYRSEVLGDLLRRDDLSGDELAAVLEATREIESDHYRSELLGRVASRGLSDPALQRAYFTTMGDFESDHYRAQSLLSLVNQDRLPADIVTGVLRSVGQMESDHYRSEVLLRVIRNHPLDGDARAAFLDAMDRMESKHYRGLVADALYAAERRR